MYELIDIQYNNNLLKTVVSVFVLLNIYIKCMKQ